MVLRSPQFCRKYALSILTGIVLCWTILSSGCNSHSKKHSSDNPNVAEGSQAAVMKNHDHPNTAEGTQAAVKEIVAVVEKSLAGLPPPPSAPAVCESEMTKLREVLKTAPGAGEAANANSALLGCISKATNEATCKGKPQPCGVVYYNPPIKPAGTEPLGPKAVDVSAPDQIAAACREIAGAGGAGPTSGVILSSLIGNYSCEAWLKAAAANDPTLLIALGFVPTIQLMRDLKTYANGVPDVTPDAVLANSVKRVDRTLVIMRVGGNFVPVVVLPFVPVGGTSGQVLDGALATAQQRVNQVSRAVEDRCKEAGICR